MREVIVNSTPLIALAYAIVSSLRDILPVTSDISYENGISCAAADKYTLIFSLIMCIILSVRL
ncbi:MAG: hypothetical protein MJ095_03310 [Oscillospiraceae bacterium]|nr:hypothetical protein [Oscillospiraceae bacterium]